MNWRGNHFAKYAVETALLDIACNRLGVPVSKLIVAVIQTAITLGAALGGDSAGPDGPARAALRALVWWISGCRMSRNRSKNVRPDTIRRKL